MGAIPKYRPVLTAEMIVHIIALAKKDLASSKYGEADTINASLISTLAPFQAKIDNAGITAAYIMAPPRKSLLESLGEINPKNIPVGHSTKEEYWKHCYYKFIEAPTTCSLIEIDGYNEHKYLNDLMTPEELTAFESKGEGI